MSRPQFSAGLIHYPPCCTLLFNHTSLLLMRLINLSFKFHSISCFTEIYDERKRNAANWSPSGDIISCKSINQWWQTSVWQEFSFLYSTLEILRTAKALLIKDEQYAAFIWEITSTGNMVIEISQISGSLVTVIIRSSWPGWQNLFIEELSFAH